MKMMRWIRCSLPAILFMAMHIFFQGCQSPGTEEGMLRKFRYRSDWKNQPDRVWIGPEWWSNPMEDWRLRDGRLECISAAGNRNVQFLTCQLTPESHLEMQVRLGRLGDDIHGRAGFLIAIQGPLDDYRHALVFGEGLMAGISTDGYIFAGDRQKACQFNGEVTLFLRLLPGDTYSRILLWKLDEEGEAESLEYELPRELCVGNIGLLADATGGVNFQPVPSFYFSDLAITGRIMKGGVEQNWGPILWTTYTLSRGVMKLSAQFPPLGEEASPVAVLELLRQGQWEESASAQIHPLARTAVFRMSGWPSSSDHRYRIRYHWDGRDHFFEGVIRKDPVDKDTLLLGVFNCDHGELFPLKKVTGTAEKLAPDLLFFAGDQIYESHGGYGVYRGKDVDLAMLNYLRKYFLFGWSWKEVLRHTPAIIIPDDHDVFQGNLWGQGGRPIPEGKRYSHGGYLMPPEWVNAVQMTQTGSLPDPVHPEPVQQGIGVYYTDLVYGRIGFAILEDRKFKSGPDDLPIPGAGRMKHFSDVDIPEAELLGKRQEEFLSDWVTRWEGTDMKAALSQTIFCKVSTHQAGDLRRVPAELDCNGWPQSKRDRALDILRRGFTFMVHGDQHLSAQVHHGIDSWEDAGVSFLVTGTSVGFLRAWWPDEPGMDKPAGKSQWTGRYFDGLGNRITVMAVGNPDTAVLDYLDVLENPEDRAQMKGSGYGLVTFNKQEKTITTKVYRVKSDVDGPGGMQLFGDWPLTIRMEDNYGRKAVAHLPEIIISGLENPVIQVVRETNGEIVYTRRIRGNRIRPGVFDTDIYTVRVGDPDTGRWKVIGNLPAGGNTGAEVEITF